MIDVKTNKNENEKESLNENSTALQPALGLGYSVLMNLMCRY